MALTAIASVNVVSVRTGVPPSQVDMAPSTSSPWPPAARLHPSERPLRVTAAPRTLREERVSRPFHCSAASQPTGLLHDARGGSCSCEGTAQRGSKNTAKTPKEHQT